MVEFQELEVDVDVNKPGETYLEVEKVRVGSLDEGGQFPYATCIYLPSWFKSRHSVC